MLVFRFEKEDGTGAYRDICYDDHTLQTGHPGPDNDLTHQLEAEINEANGYLGCPMGYIQKKFGYKDEYSNNLIFAFESMKQAYAWFSKDEIVDLQIPKDVHLYAYVVPEEFVVKFQRQVVFDKSKATRV